MSQYLDNDKEIKRLITKKLTVSESENEDLNKYEHENKRKYEDENEHESRRIIYSYHFLYQRKLSIAIFITFIVVIFFLQFYLIVFFLKYFSCKYCSIVFSFIVLFSNSFWVV